jgi:SWI/SNF-related matrix-associated actin-dependent regulator of chromatin subfamily A-like protein 1
MNPPLFPHQAVAAHRLAHGIPTYLGLDMGIGKTRVFIEAAKARGARRVLALVPATAILVWKREIKLWHGEARVVVVKSAADLHTPATYYLVSHGLMSQKNGPIPYVLASGPAFEMTAVDEAHAFNAPQSNRVTGLRYAAPKLGHITPMSGTPMRNHAGDLYTLLSICWPQGLTSRNVTNRSNVVMTRQQFEERFCRVTHKTFGGSRMIRVIEGSKNLDTLKKMIAPFMMRVRKEDVFKDLPPILWDSVPVPLDPGMMPAADLEAFEKAVSYVFARPSHWSDKWGSDEMAEVLRAMSGNTGLMAMRRLLGLAKLRGATEYLVDMLDNLPENRKVLVFAHHAHVIAALVRHLGEYSPAVLVGTTQPRDREISVDKFLTDPRCRVFVGNIQAAGQAITLVGPTCKCSDVVFVESSWTPMDNAQAACRIHRVGQHDGVVARMLSAAGTVDDLINGLLVRKAREFTALFDEKPPETTGDVT